jgi:hypothetical protein
MIAQYSFYYKEGAKSLKKIFNHRKKHHFKKIYSFGMRTNNL